MKKLIIAALLFAISSSAIAGAASTTQDYNDSTGIIRPEVASGVIRTDNIAYTPDREIVVCPKEYHSYERGNVVCMDLYKKSKWRYIKDMVPRGRTYVGFKSVSGAYGYHYIEIYYK